MSRVEGIYIRVGARIAELRAQRGLTQEELAARAQLSPNYIARTEGAYHRTNLARLEAIAETLEVSLAAPFRTAAGPPQSRPPSSATRVLASLDKEDLQVVMQLARHLQRASASPRRKSHHNPRA